MTASNPEPSDCVFCKIMADELPSSRVYESETVIAFMDLYPVTPGHLLVVPREHRVTLADLTDDLGAEMMRVARRLAAALRVAATTTEEIEAAGVNLFLADGEAAGQEVFHAHLHVIPRFPGDGFGLRVSRGPNPSRAALDGLAAAVRTSVVE